MPPDTLAKRIAEMKTAANDESFDFESLATATNVLVLIVEIERLDCEVEKLVDECGHWRAEAEHYAQRPLEDFE